MSGTSLDGVDGTLVDFATSPRVLAHASRPFPLALRAELLDLNSPGPNELHRAALAADQLARLYADVVADLLQHTSLQAAQVRAIGAHGQTVRHHPFEPRYSLQLNQPAMLAELTGIDVVADFRSRDLAAGGQGAPLVPAFHQAVFGQPGRAVAVLNLGGIANLSLLGTDGSVRGFDCGPANALLDLWCERHTGAAYDAQGAWAASGQVSPALLAHMLAEPYFALPPPKSTGRDLFHANWLAARLARQPGLAPVDVQATLAQLTVEASLQSLRRHASDSQELIVCGGGALNRDLMQRLQAGLPGVPVLASDARGLPAQQVEAAAFAWLAHKALRREPANLPTVTGAQGPRVLGALYPA